MTLPEKIFMRFSLEERRKRAFLQYIRERGELQALNTDELGFEFMCVKIEYEHRKNKTWMFFFLFMFFFVNFGSSFLSTLGTVCYHWNGYPPHEQEAIGLCLFLLGFFGVVVVGGLGISVCKNRKCADHLQRKILVIEEIQNERKKK